MVAKKLYQKENFDILYVCNNFHKYALFKTISNVFGILKNGILPKIDHWNLIKMYFLNIFFKKPLWKKRKFNGLLAPQLLLGSQFRPNSFRKWKYSCYGRFWVVARRNPPRRRWATSETNLRYSFPFKMNVKRVPQTCFAYISTFTRRISTCEDSKSSLAAIFSFTNEIRSKLTTYKKLRCQ